MLTQKDIIDMISTKHDLHPGQVKRVIDELIDIISGQMEQLVSIRLHGLGTFVPNQTNKRIGRNPRTGEPIKIPPKVRIRFKPGFRMTRSSQAASSKMKLEETAKLMVSELLLYNSKEIDDGILFGDIETRLQSKLKDARANFRERLSNQSDAGMEIFETVWKKFIERRAKALKAMS